MSDIFDFDIGKHGIYIILFDGVHGLHKKTALFLPEVAKE